MKKEPSLDVFPVFQKPFLAGTESIGRSLNGADGLPQKGQNFTLLSIAELQLGHTIL